MWWIFFYKIIIGYDHFANVFEIIANIHISKSSILYWLVDMGVDIWNVREYRACLHYKESGISACKNDINIVSQLPLTSIVNWAAKEIYHADKVSTRYFVHLNAAMERWNNIKCAVWMRDAHNVMKNAGRGFPT